MPDTQHTRDPFSEPLLPEEVSTVQRIAAGLQQSSSELNAAHACYYRAWVRRLNMMKAIARELERLGR